MEFSTNTVVITGVGVLACNATGREAFWNALEAGRSGIGILDRFDASEFPCQMAGQLDEFNPSDYMSDTEVRRSHRHVHMAVAATSLAVNDAELSAAGYDPERVATGMGTSVGVPDEHYERYMKLYMEHGWKKLGKLSSSASSGHAPTAAVTACFSFRGPATTIASGCATGLDVLNWGREQVRMGLADTAVVGAVESPLTRPTFAATCALGILSERNDAPEQAMRPFDRESDGLVLSEGAVVLVLERYDRAKSRGARILGEVAGYGSASEGNNPYILDSEGKAVARAIEMALHRSRMSAVDVDCAHCHGVSLPMYDKCEANGYKKALEGYAHRIPMTANKSMLGQAYAAGGLLSVSAALMSLERGVLPPTINLHQTHPECDLDFVPGHARVNDIQTALVTALSFGGTHSALLLRNLN